jgi:3-phenylpropionate/cinnamic acid dioxygenase small subunit
MKQSTAEARSEIEQLITRYCYVFDDRAWARFEALFTSDAHLDYRDLGGPAGSLDVILEDTKDRFPDSLRTQHSVSSILLDVNGDMAAARTVCHALAIDMAGPAESSMLFALWYEDELRLTGVGWRIHRRVAKRFGLLALGLAAPI